MATSERHVFKWKRGARRPSNVVVWLGCVVFLVVAALLVNTLLPVEFSNQAQAGFFEPAGVIAIAVMGLIGAWLADRTGFPAPLGPDVPPLRRFGPPAVIGAGLGLALLITDAITGMSQLQREHFDLPATSVPFPASLVVYSAGAIISEVVFRLLPIPLLLWPLTLLTKNRGSELAFWVLAVLTSLIEPLSQSVVTSVLDPLPQAAVMTQQFAANLAQAAYFRRYGFLAAITLRLGFYAVTHVVGPLLA